MSKYTNKSPQGSRERGRRLGTLIADTLKQEGMSRADFASRLGLDGKWVDAIIGGIFPLSQIDDDLLASMAQHLGLSDETLRVLRDPPPASNGTGHADIFSMLQTVQDEFSADGQDARPNLRKLNALLNEVREGKSIEEPPQTPNGSPKLGRITDTLKSFVDEGGEEDAQG